jgi:ArsR family transcriptional regulator
LVKQLAGLCRVGGAVVVLDYARHDDESMRDQADLWLGFEPSELRRFARAAGLAEAHVAPIPSSLNGRGPDAHLAWQVMVAHNKTGSLASHRRPSKNGREHDHG